MKKGNLIFKIYVIVSLAILIVLLGGAILILSPARGLLNASGFRNGIRIAQSDSTALELDLEPGEMTSLRSTKLTGMTSDPSVAVVKDGMVQAVGEGECYVSVKQNSPLSTLMDPTTYHVVVKDYSDGISLGTLKYSKEDLSDIRSMLHSVLGIEDTDGGMPDDMQAMYDYNATRIMQARN